MVAIAATLTVQPLDALCHVQHEKSVRVLERCGFLREGSLHRHAVFPNMEDRESQDVYCYVQIHTSGMQVTNT